MLSAADAQLVRRDPQIPGLGMLLDPEAFAETLQRLYPDAGVVSAEPGYLRYKPNTSCLVGYWVVSKAGKLDVYARAHNPAMNCKITNAAQQRSVPGPLGPGIVVLGEPAVAIYVHPNDHELRSLGRVTVAKDRWRLIKHLLPDHPHLWEGSLERLRYKPERRYVARLRAADEQGAALKFYEKRDFTVASENANAFVSQGELRVARRLRRSQRHRVAALEWLEGVPMRDALLIDRSSVDVSRRVGAALACLHDQTPRLRTRYTVESCSQALDRAAEAVAAICPQLAKRATRASQSAARLLLEQPWTLRAIHGDFSIDQVLLVGDRISILDFDRAGYGDPRMDLGTLRAKLACDVICGVLDLDRANSSFGALLEEYRRSRDEDLTRDLALFTAVGLLQCAVEPFRHRHENWPEKVEMIITQSEELVGRPEGAGRS